MRSIHAAIDEGVAAAVKQGRITDGDRSSVKQFAGFKGEDDGTDPQRYYLNDQLSEYVEIAQSEVIAEIGLAGDDSPLVLVLTKADAALQHHLHINGGPEQLHLTQSTQSEFLTGNISQRHLSSIRSANSGLAATAAGQAAAPTIYCNTLTFNVQARH